MAMPGRRVGAFTLKPSIVPPDDKSAVRLHAGIVDDGEQVLSDTAGDDTNDRVGTNGAQTVLESSVASSRYFEHRRLLIEEYLKLTGDRGGEAFGSSAAMSDKYIAIGAPGSNSSFIGKAVYLYSLSFDVVNSSFSVERLDVLQESLEDATYDYGASLALSGQTLVVGAPNSQAAGGAYIYQAASNSESTVEFEMMKHVQASSGSSGDDFGSSVAIHTDLIVVGAPGQNKVCVFKFATGAWSDEIVSLSVALTSDGSKFGYSVAINENLIAVGAPYHADDSGCKGAVFVFRTDDHGWSWSDGLELKGGCGEELGYAVGLYGNTLACGAPRNDDDAINGGAAYVFSTHDGGLSWLPNTSEPLVSGSLDNSDFFGRALSIDHSTLVVGAPFRNRPPNSGEAWFWTFSNGTWNLISRLDSSDDGVRDQLGTSVAMHGGLSVLGAPGEEAAYIYDLQVVTNPTNQPTSQPTNRPTDQP
eukprot:CAMPEP_0185708908 /NCGR_PEP_ID=MMETSP1164-20130828/27539_1 /TAXON_ID=1104430 /ORGANISM="Chrysoreinhardia sp, Strain CCMP2950" /LENGTH=473 /DNA_ID=CAMNT_0028376379 /DNA_START=373 /DNA_END=1790 /DNA_ORIENTATION=-